MTFNSLIIIIFIIGVIAESTSLSFYKVKYYECSSSKTSIISTISAFNAIILVWLVIYGFMNLSLYITVPTMITAVIISARVKAITRMNARCGILEESLLHKLELPIALIAFMAATFVTEPLKVLHII